MAEAMAAFTSSYCDVIGQAGAIAHAEPRFDARHGTACRANYTS
jgi:hypothetical protein